MVAQVPGALNFLTKDLKDIADSMLLWLIILCVLMIDWGRCYSFTVMILSFMYRDRDFSVTLSQSPSKGHLDHVGRLHSWSM